MHGKIHERPGENARESWGRVRDDVRNQGQPRAMMSWQEQGGVLLLEIQRSMVPLTLLFQTPASRTVRQDASVSRGNENRH